MLFITKYKALQKQIENTEVTINRRLQNWYCTLSFLVCFSFLDGCKTVTRVDCSSVAGTRLFAQTYVTFKRPERERRCSAKLCGCKDCIISGSGHYLAEIKAVDSIFHMKSV